MKTDTATRAKKPAKQLRCCRFACEPLPPASAARLYEAAGYVQQATNMIWNAVIANHRRAGRDVELAEFYVDYARWSAGGFGPDDKPALGFNACEFGDEKAINVHLAETLPFLHGRCLGLQARKIFSLIRSKDRKWQRVLLNREACPQSIHRLPIAFDKMNGDIVLRDGRVCVQVRVLRHQAPGRVNSASMMETLVLKLGQPAKCLLSQRVREIAEGQRDWAGSSIFWDRRKHTWCVSIAAVIEAPPPLPKVTAKTAAAALSAPEIGCCWLLRCGEEHMEIGSGRRVRHLRIRLDRAKQGRQADSFAARSGRGGAKLLAASARLAGVWNRTCKTLNNQAVAQITRALERAKLTCLDYAKPTPRSLINAVAAEVGPAWPEFQFREILGRKCREQGIALRIVGDESQATNDVATS